MDWLVKDFKNSYGVDLSADKMALRRLRETAEKTKIELSSSTESQINLPYITHSEQGRAPARPISRQTRRCWASAKRARAYPVTHAFLPLLRASDNPRIVNVSSGVGSFARRHYDTPRRRQL